MQTGSARLALLACIGLLGVGCFDQQYQCTTDDNCARDTSSGGATTSASGYCQTAPGGNRYCLFADSGCASKLRWDATALPSIAGTCSTSTCTDKLKNGALGSFETDVDCGGDLCPRCADTKKCLVDTDCVSALCVNGACRASSCSDGVLNGDESDVDCGGGCAGCADRKLCNLGSDCASDLCQGARCVSCEDGVKNAAESDVDCGGNCAPCGYAKSCNVNADCLSDACMSGRQLCTGRIHFDSPCYRVDGEIQTMTTGDWNHDGMPDFAVATDKGTLELLTAIKGPLDERTFVRRTLQLGLTLPTRVLATDLDGDRSDDLIIVDFAGPVQVLFGDGSGGFTAPITLPTDARAEDVVAGDFMNGDGVPDIAVAIADSNKNEIMMWRGLGKRGYAKAITQPALHSPALVPASAPSFLLLGHFDDDAVLDLAVESDSYVSFVLSSGAVTDDVQLQSFARPSRMTLGQWGTHDAVIVGSNALLSLVVRDTSAGATPVIFREQYVPLLYTYRPSSYNQPMDQVTADWNRDRNIDIAAIVSDMGTVQLFEGTGTKVTPFFTKPRYTYYVGDNYPSYASTTTATGAVGDWNGDGEQDLAVLVQNGGEVCLLPGNGKGDFGDGSVGLAGSFGVSGFPGSVAVGDFNGDGKPDVASVSAGVDAVTVLFGDGAAGVAGKAQTLPLRGSPRDLAVGRLDGDLLADIAVVNDSGENVNLFFARPGGSFSPAATVDYNGQNPFAVIIGDFDGDSLNDLAVTNYYDSTLIVRRGDGKGGFAVSSGFPTPLYPTGLVAADFDGDGARDIAVASITGRLGIFYGLGKGEVNFRPWVEYNIDYGAENIAVGDFNSDGKPDLAISNGYSSTLLIAMNAGGQGDAAFVVGAPVRLGDEALTVVTGDFDGNRTVDVAVAVNGGVVQFLPGLGNGSFAAPTPISVPFQTTAIAAVDWNSDGRLDLALSVRRPSAITIIRNDTF